MSLIPAPSIPEWVRVSKKQAQGRGELDVRHWGQGRGACREPGEGSTSLVPMEGELGEWRKGRGSPRLQPLSKILSLGD